MRVIRKLLINKLRKVLMGVNYIHQTIQPPTGLVFPIKFYKG